MQNEEYNGWTNRETWAAHLWLANNHDLYQSYRGLTAQEIEAGLVGWLSQPLIDHKERDMQQQMLLEIGSLWRVRWSDVAKALAEDTP